MGDEYSVITRNVPLRTRAWRKIRYPGIRFAKTRQFCTDPACSCCLPKELK